MKFGIKKIKDEGYRSLISLYIKELKKSVAKLRSVMVIGSVARGKRKKTGDIDLVIVFDSKPYNLFKRIDFLSDIFLKVKESKKYAKLMEKGYSVSLMPIPYKGDELYPTPPLLLDAIYDGIIIMDDGTLERKFISLKKRLKELGSKRVKGKRHWYWILKPDIKPGEVFEI
ncbi:MAG: nucleotidyltransferase domain-containing protein [Candidatus Thermoplasmatota archaeon]